MEAGKGIGRLSQLLIVYTLITCGFSCTDRSMPAEYRQALLHFDAFKSQQARAAGDGNKLLVFGLLWNSSNRINARCVRDTVFAEVNGWLNASLAYEGGCRFEGDTLFLYAKKLRAPVKDSVHATLSYIISSSGHAFGQVVFRELP